MRGSAFAHPSISRDELVAQDQQREVQRLPAHRRWSNRLNAGHCSGDLLSGVDVEHADPQRTDQRRRRDIGRARAAVDRPPFAATVRFAAHRLRRRRRTGPVGGTVRGLRDGGLGVQRRARVGCRCELPREEQRSEPNANPAMTQQPCSHAGECTLGAKCPFALDQSRERCRPGSAANSATLLVCCDCAATGARSPDRAGAIPPAAAGRPPRPAPM